MQPLYISSTYFTAFSLLLVLFTFKGCRFHYITYLLNSSATCPGFPTTNTYHLSVWWGTTSGIPNRHKFGGFRSTLFLQLYTSAGKGS